jgi:hypothetical protein
MLAACLRAGFVSAGAKYGANCVRPVMAARRSGPASVVLLSKSSAPGMPMPLHIGRSSFSPSDDQASAGAGSKLILPSAASLASILAASLAMVGFANNSCESSVI